MTHCVIGEVSPFVSIRFGLEFLIARSSDIYFLILYVQNVSHPFKKLVRPAPDEQNNTRNKVLKFSDDWTSIDDCSDEKSTFL